MKNLYFGYINEIEEIITELRIRMSELTSEIEEIIHAMDKLENSHREFEYQALEELLDEKEDEYETVDMALCDLEYSSQSLQKIKAF